MATPLFHFKGDTMCKQISNYFEMIIDRKESVVVLPREYKGSPMLGYSPDILITTERIYNKYKSHILCDTDKTKIIYMQD